MPKGIYAAASAMVVETRALEVTAQNMANAQTSGYRKQIALRDDFAQALAAQGRTGDISADGGAGILPSDSYYSFKEGIKQKTDNPFDVAISGEGFFRVISPQGKSLLTRAGNFSLNTLGQLVTPEGHLVEGQGGPISIPSDSTRVTVDLQGRIYSETPSETGPVQTFVDQLRVVTVSDPHRLSAVNGQFFDSGSQDQGDAFTPVQVAGEQPKRGAIIQQGYAEGSNVDTIQELVNMISIQRRYDAAQRALKQQSATGADFSDLLRGA